MSPPRDPLPNNLLRLAFVLLGSFLHLPLPLPSSFPLSPLEILSEGPMTRRRRSVEDAQKGSELPGVGWRPREEKGGFMYPGAVKGGWVRPGGGSGEFSRARPGEPHGWNLAIKDSSPTLAAHSWVSCPQVPRLGSEAGRAGVRGQGGKDCSPRGTWSLGFQAHQSGEGMLGRLEPLDPPLRPHTKMSARSSGAFPGGLESALPPLVRGNPQHQAGWLPPGFPGGVRAPFPLSCWRLCGWRHTRLTRFILCPGWGHGQVLMIEIWRLDELWRSRQS